MMKKMVVMPLTPMLCVGLAVTASAVPINKAPQINKINCVLNVGAFVND